MSRSRPLRGSRGLAHRGRSEERFTHRGRPEERLTRRGRPKKPGAGVAHLRRPQFTRWTPVHVTLRVLPNVRNLRGCSLFRCVHRALSRGATKPAFRLVDYSVQRNHFHFNVEALDSQALARGVQGLVIRLARAINRRMRRRGKVFRDRFFSRTLRTPVAVRNARRYVMNNARRHARGARRNAYTLRF